MENERRSVSLEKILGVLLRGAPRILLCMVVVAGVAYGVSKLQTKKYTATASLVFNNNQPGQQAAGLPVVSSNNEQAQENTNVKLVQLGDMAAQTARALDHGLTKEKVAEELSVSGQPESNIVNVSATATSPPLAAHIANTYTNLFVSEQQNSNHQYYSAALSLVNKQLAALPPQQSAGSAGLALQERAQSLAVLAELQSGTVQVAQAATIPISPSSPKLARNTVIGAVLGLLLGLLLVFLVERFDPRISEPTDLEAIYGVPLLGVVAESRALAHLADGRAQRSGGARAELPASDEEAFQLIRAHLRYFNVDRELRVLLVASPTRGDGKTTVAVQLAVAAAGAGSSVLLLESDLRRPTVARQLDLESGPGIADVLIGSASLSEATQSILLDEPIGVIGQEPRLDVLVAGFSLPPNPGKLIESNAMEIMLSEARSEYDLVVIDTPPLSAVSDAFSLLPKVDGVIVVGWVGSNRRDAAERLHQTLEGADAPVLGVVANRFRTRRRSSAHGYNPEEQLASTSPVATYRGRAPFESGAVSRGAAARTGAQASQGADGYNSDEPVPATGTDSVPQSSAHLRGGSSGSSGSRWR
jgi:succinoglycan biosynthesis transport protein ExoP